MFIPLGLRDKFGGRLEIRTSTRTHERSTAALIAAQTLAEWKRLFLELTAVDVLAVVDGVPEMAGTGVVYLDDAAKCFGVDPLRLADELVGAGAPLMCSAAGWSGHLLDSLDEVEIDYDGRRIFNSIEDLSPEQSLTDRLVVDGSRYFLESWRRSEDAFIGKCWAIRSKMWFWPAWESQRLAVRQVQVRKSDVEAVRIQWIRGIAPARIEAERKVALGRAHGSLGSVHAVASAVTHRHADLKISDVIEKYLKAQIVSGKWKPDEQRRQRGKLRTFCELMGDPTSGDLSLRPEGEDLVHAYAEKLTMFPANADLRRARQSLGADATATALVDWAEEKGVPRLNELTIESYLKALQQCFNWAVDKDYITSNAVASALKDRKKPARKRADHARVLFSAEELAVIFGAEIFKGEPPRTADGRPHTRARPHIYWAPLIGIFMGLRCNETAQLYLDDFGVDPDGTPWLWVRSEKPDQIAGIDDDDSDLYGASTTDKSVKSSAGNRKVAVNPYLTGLGLMDYVAALKKERHERLFPYLWHDSEKGYGKALSKWFNEAYLGKRLGIPRDGTKTFHTLRHHFGTALDRAVPQHARLRRQLMGHARGGEGGELLGERYAKDWSPGEMLEYVVKIRPAGVPEIAPFDVRWGVAAAKRKT